jgi:hypothetical protein
MLLRKDYHYTLPPPPLPPSLLSSHIISHFLHAHYISPSFYKQLQLQLQQTVAAIQCNNVCPYLQCTGLPYAHKRSAIGQSPLQNVF